MRILLNDYAGHPFQVELARELALRGHEVAHLYCSSNSTPHGDLTDHGIETLQIVPISTGETFEKYSLVKRTRDELRYGFRSGKFERAWSPDVVLLSNVPILSVHALTALNRGRHRVLWLQDIQAGLVSMVLKGWKRPLAHVFNTLERLVIRHASSIVAIAGSLALEAQGLGADPDKTVVIENWAPIADIPLLDRRNEWSSKHGLDDKFVFLYSGTLGMKHRPDLMLKLVEEFDDDPDVRVVVASEGVGSDWLAERKLESKLPGLVLLPFQPFSDLPEMLASADVLTVVLEQEAGSYSIPSKILSYLCAGRAVLGSLPESNSAAEMLNTRAGAGLSTSDDEEFLGLARRLRNDAQLRHRLGNSGRAYAEQAFPIGRVADRFEQVLTGDTPHPGD